MLQALLARPGTILSRSELERQIYGWNEEVESNAIEFLIHTIRKKLGATAIRNVRGVGWMVDRRVTRSLRARLFVGMTAIILLAGLGGGVFTYLWAFDEAIEMQDSILTQIGSLLQDESIKTNQSLSGVDPEAEVEVVELGMAPHGPAEDRQL